MKPYLPYLRLAPVLAASVLVLATTASSFADYMSETEFNSVASGSDLAASTVNPTGGIPGWAMSNAGASWLVDTASDYEGTGNGAHITSANVAIRTLAGAEIVTDPSASFQADVLVTPGTEHRYFSPYLWVEGVGGSGGNYGVGIRFTGGSSTVSPGDAGGSIGYMSGGSDWWNIASINSYANSGWKTQTWYTVRFDDVGTSPTLTIYETANPSNIVLDHVAMGTFGGDTFTQIDRIGLRESSTARNTAYDNFILGTIPVPEPASLGLLALGGLALLRRHRHA